MFIHSAHIGVDNLHFILHLSVNKLTLTILTYNVSWVQHHNYYLGFSVERKKIIPILHIKHQIFPHTSSTTTIHHYNHIHSYGSVEKTKYSFTIKIILQDAFPLDSVINWILLGWPDGVPLDPASGTVFTPVGVDKFPRLDSDLLFPEGVVSMPDGVFAPFALIESVLALFSESLWSCAVTTGEVASLVVSRIRFSSPLLVSVSMIITGSSDWNRKISMKTQKFFYLELQRACFIYLFACFEAKSKFTVPQCALGD